MKYELIIFDMDGTILYTLDDLMNSLNYALGECGYPGRTLQEVRAFVGNGIRKLIERSLPADVGEDVIDKVLSIFTPHYSEHNMDTTRPYEGVIDLLKYLKNNGYKTAVVSNKVDDAVQELCDRMFNGLFDLAVGEKAGFNKKPAPDSVYYVLDELKVNKDKAVYIGDSDVDAATAFNSGLDLIAVDWGFRDRDVLIENGATTIVSTPSEIIDLI